MTPSLYQSGSSARAGSCRLAGLAPALVNGVEVTARSLPTCPSAGADHRSGLRPEARPPRPFGVPSTRPSKTSTQDSLEVAQVHDPILGRRVVEVQRAEPGRCRQARSDNPFPLTREGSDSWGSPHQ